MDTGKFQCFRREGAVRNHDSFRTVVDPLRRHDLLNRVVSDAHSAAILRLETASARTKAQGTSASSALSMSVRAISGLVAKLISSGPDVGQIELPVDQRLAKPARISQENANLRILDAPRCPRILPGYAHRRRSLFPQNAIGIAKCFDDIGEDGIA